MKGLYGGLTHQDTHENVKNFIDVCSPFLFKNMLQESIRLTLSPPSLTGDSYHDQ